MKKVICLLTSILLLSVSLAGCGGEQAQAPAETPATGTETPAESTPVDPGESYEINFAIHTNEGTNEYKTIERFKEAVESKTNGQIAIHLFPGASLGTEMENLDQIKMGEVEMSIFGDLLSSQLAPEYDPTVVPFIYPSVEDVYDTWNGELGEKIKEAIVTNGNQYLVSLQARGARNLTANSEIKSPADLAGLKLRIPEIASWVTIWKGLGAMPTPVAWSETYSALQTKVVDAQENPFENIFVAKIYEVQEYVMLTQHLFNVFHWTINKDFYDSLPADYQQIIMESAQEACEWGDQQLAAREEEVKAEIINAGAKVVEVDRQVFIDAAKPFVDEVAKSWDPMAVKEIEKFYQ